MMLLSSHRKQQAFTLIEIMLVIAIFAILSAAVVISISSVESRRINSQALQLTKWLSNAEFEASLTGSTLGIVVRGDTLLLTTLISGQWFEIDNIRAWSATDGVLIKALNAKDQNTTILRQAPTIKSLLIPEQLSPFILIGPSGKLQTLGALWLQSDAHQVIIITAEQTSLEASL